VRKQGEAPDKLGRPVELLDHREQQLPDDEVIRLHSRQLRRAARDAEGIGELRERREATLALGVRHLDCGGHGRNVART